MDEGTHWRGHEMEKATRRRPTEIRFSPLSLLWLFFIWVGVSGLAFYVGILVGRMEQMREIRTVYRAEETVVAEEELPLLSFEEGLTVSDGEAVVGHPPVVPKARPAEALSKPSAEDGQTGVVVLQISSFRELERAERLVQELRKRGYPCFLRAPDPSGADGGYSRVFVGPLPSAEKAAEVKERLEQGEGYKDILIRSLGKKEEDF